MNQNKCRIKDSVYAAFFCNVKAIRKRQPEKDGTACEPLIISDNGSKEEETSIMHWLEATDQIFKL